MTGDRKGKRAPEYNSWANMHTRCYNPNRPTWARYGGRGIKVCRRWHTYENFLADMGRMPRPGDVLDRKDGDKDYCKSNCQWTTRADSSTRTCRVRQITYLGETKTLREWVKDPRCVCDDAGQLYQRLHTLRWTVEEAMKRPRQQHTPTTTNPLEES